MYILYMTFFEQNIIKTKIAQKHLDMVSRSIEFKIKLNIIRVKHNLSAAKILTYIICFYNTDFWWSGIKIHHFKFQLKSKLLLSFYLE